MIRLRRKGQPLSDSSVRLRVSSGKPASEQVMFTASLWNRVDLDSSDHMSFFHHSRVQSLCSWANWRLVSDWPHWLVVFLRLHSCSVPIPWVPFTLCVWKCSYCQGSVVVFLSVDFTKRLSDHWSRSFRIYFWPRLPGRRWFPMFLPVLNNALDSS